MVKEVCIFPVRCIFAFHDIYRIKNGFFPALIMKEIWIFPVQCIVAFRVILRIKNGPPKQHQATSFAQTTQCAFCPVRTDFLDVI